MHVKLVDAVFLSDMNATEQNYLTSGFGRKMPTNNPKITTDHFYVRLRLSVIVET